MAESAAHRLGQIIGEALEAALVPLLKEFAAKHSLYLDGKGVRPARSGLKCSWVDVHGNSHDLDYVLERGGTPEKVGTPVAFIETAWRRYTKHSRNKVQEIQGAIEPLAQTYHNSAPFKGAVLAGVFTEGALSQLRSLGYTVVYFSYESVVAVFRRFGIETSSTEETPERQFKQNVKRYETLSALRKSRLAAELAKAHADQIQGFFESLSLAVLRQVERIIVLALHGETHEVTSIGDAIQFIESYAEKRAVRKRLDRFEILVRYTNGNTIDAKFKDKTSAIDFLRSYEPVQPKVK